MGCECRIRIDINEERNERIYDIVRCDHCKGLEARLASLETGKLPAFGKLSLADEVRLLRQFFTDTTDAESDWPCLPSCDSHGHAPDCPHVHPAQAFRKLLERVNKLEAALRSAYDSFDSMCEMFEQSIKDILREALK